MSADTVTDAVVNWFGPPNVVGLNKVWDAAPWFDGAVNFDLASELGWGAVSFVHLSREGERRIAMGGSQGGIKKVVYDVAIAIQFKFVIPTDYDPQSGPTAYRRALNTLLDGMRTRLRQDRTMGTAPGVDGLGGIDIATTGSILQAGEGDGSGGEDIIVERDLPRKDVGILWSWNSFNFQVVEMAAT